MSLISDNMMLWRNTKYSGFFFLSFTWFFFLLCWKEFLLAVDYVKKKKKNLLHLTVLTSTVIQTPPFPSFVFSHKWGFVWLAVNASMVQTKTLCNSVLSNHSGFCNEEAPVCLPLICSSPVKGNTPGSDIFFVNFMNLWTFFALNFNSKLWRQLIPVSPFVQWRLSECYTCIHITRSQPQSVHLHAL